MRRVDVVIVGAGAAGLMAACDLRARGCKVLVLEARDRIGGRILTHHDPRVPLPVELGAEFIHGEAPLTESLLREAGLSVLSVRGEYLEAHRGSLRQVDYFGAVERVLRHLDPERADESMAAFLSRRPGGRALARDRALIRQFVEGYYAADLSLISASSLAGGDESPSDSARSAARVTQGYGSLMDWLARDLGASLRLGSEVKRIAWRRGHATVDARSRHTARAVVVTVPVGVLRAHAGIAFDPEPGRVRRALEGIEVGAVVRMVVWFRDVPRALSESASKGAGFLRLPGGPFQVLWTVDPVRWPMAVAWCGGPAATELSRTPRADVERVMRAQLARALGTSPGALRKDIRRVWWHNWERDRFARGAYTYLRVGALNANQLLGKAEQQTLFFAGEATEADGTVEAALTSGRRAARQVLRAID